MRRVVFVIALLGVACGGQQSSGPKPAAGPPYPDGFEVNEYASVFVSLQDVERTTSPTGATVIKGTLSNFGSRAIEKVVAVVECSGDRQKVVVVGGSLEPFGPGRPAEFTVPSGDCGAPGDFTLHVQAGPPPADPGNIGTWVIRHHCGERPALGTLAMRTGEVVTVGDQCMIGRQYGGVRVGKDSSVSRLHAIVSLDFGGNPILVDTASTNGVILPGESVERSTLKLEDDTYFYLGEVLFWFTTAVATQEQLTKHGLRGWSP